MVAPVVLVIGVRGSICESVNIVGAGAPGGVSGPWAKSEVGIVNRARARAARFITFLLLRTDPNPRLRRVDNPNTQAGKEGKSGILGCWRWRIFALSPPHPGWSRTYRLGTASATTVVVPTCTQPLAPTAVDARATTLPMMGRTRWKL